MRIKGKVFTLGYLAKLITWRQAKKNTDTIIFIYGARRTGKTNLGFQILKKYLKLKREEYSKGEGIWNPPHFWKEHFQKYFGATAEDTKDKIKQNEPESYIFLDEGDDTLSWHGQMDQLQQSLTRMFLKSGKKKIMCTIITPNLSILQKNILSCGHYFFWITREPDPKSRRNYAYVFKNYENQVLREKNPFGIVKIMKDVERKKMLSDTKQFERYLEKQERCVAKIYFREIDADLYDLYDELVKDPLINESHEKKKYVKISEYNKIKYALDTILYNLDLEQQKLPRICNLLKDKYGRQTVTRTTVQRWIENIHALEYKPETMAEEEEKEKDRFSNANIKDIEITSV